MHAIRKVQNPQTKQWKQEHRMTTRKLDDSEKTILKFLTTFISANPDKGQSAGKIVAEYESRTGKIDKESNLVYGKLRKIQENVGELKETLKYFDKTNESLIKVQKLSENIFEKMEGMKGDMAASYDQLYELEQRYSADLELYDRRIEAGFENDYQDPQPIPQKNKQNVHRHNKQKFKAPQQNNYMEQQQTRNDNKVHLLEMKMKEQQTKVEEVDSQIRQLGKNLGWHQEDHKDFITIWNRSHPHKNYFEIEDELADYFKVYTNEQIQDHMNKHIKAKKLNEKKKFLIQQYKELKEEKRAEELAILQSNEYQRERKVKKEQNLRKMQEEQKEMKEKVEQWKKKKQEDKLLERKKAQEEQERKKREQMDRKKQQQLKRKQILDKWKEEKQQQKQKESVMRRSTQRPHSAVNKQTRERIKEREEQIIKQKMEKALQKKMQKEELTKKAQKIKQQKLIKYAHVGSKLDQKTTAMKEKQRDKFDGKQKKDANTFGGQLLMTGVRAIPQWRQGL